MPHIHVNRRALANFMLPAILPEYDEEGELIGRRPCHVVVATRENLDAAAAPEGHEHGTNVELGSLLVIPTNRPGYRVPLAEVATHPLGITVPARDDEGELVLGIYNPFNVHERELMITALRDLGEVDDERMVLARQDATRWLDTIETYFADLRELSADADAEIPQDLLNSAWIASATDTYGNIELPNGLSAEDLGRYCKAQQLRSQIAEIQPDHPDAGTVADLGNILHDAAGETVNGSYAHAVRGAAFAANENLSRMVRGNDRLAREVFGVATTTRIEDLQCSLIQRDRIERIRDNMEATGHRIDAEWTRGVIDNMRQILTQTMPGYQNRCQIDVFSVQNRDILLVSDHMGGYAYSWPSEDRRPLMEIGQRHIAGFEPNEIPSEDEIRRLSEMLSELRNAQHLAMDEREERGAAFDM